MNYEFVAIPDDQVPQAADPVFQHLVSTIAIGGLGSGLSATCSKRWGDGPWVMPLEPDDVFLPDRVTYSRLFFCALRDRQRMEAQGDKLEWAALLSELEAVQYTEVKSEGKLHQAATERLLAATWTDGAQADEADEAEVDGQG